MIKKGDTIQIKKAYQDEGDDLYNWVALDDEEKGRVTISPTNTGLNIAPSHVVAVYMLEV